ncbi:PilZ domain-containing protein [Methylobacterium radiodurans]|uniref:PilZ domain-containing protein n=1 Tax=Methylobacterium radiodurans TaxID=2202828 RepID=A0A2U8VYY1_9HYPH|nr:PilZ domain-containing protein [Methylobacterium radiodurans]
MIAVDEHTSLPCLIYDLSEHGVRLVSLDATCVPEVFLLAATRFPEPRVCRAVWRGAEEIGARFVVP